MSSNTSSSRLLVLIAAVLTPLSACTKQAETGRVSELEQQVSELVQEINDLKVAETSAVASSTSTTQLATTTTTDPAAIAVETFTWQENSDRVKELQELIGATPDGSYGPRTREKHIDYLKTNGLSVDGVPSPPKSSGGGGSSSAPVPEGGLIFDRCSSCGQGFSSGSCANWTISVTNSSNVKVVSMTFAPPAAGWRDRTSARSDVPATAPPRKINLNLEPWARGIFQFQICTDTPSPGSGWEYFNLAPRSVGVVWSNGARGSSCYNLGCY